MAALSALLPIANIEKSQQSPNKQENTSASKQANKAAQSLEDQRHADEKEQHQNKEFSEFSLMYKEDLRTYGDAEPLDNQVLTPLTEAEFGPLNADEPIQTALVEGSVLPLTGDNLPLTEGLSEEPVYTTMASLDAQVVISTPAQDSAQSVADRSETGLLSITTPPANKLEGSLAETANTADVNDTQKLAVSAVGEMRQSEATAKASSLAPLDAKADDAANDSVGKPVALPQLSAEAESTASKPDVAGWQKEQADIVRSWRGITPREGTSLQAGTQDFSKPIQAMGQQGQIQQFAESLRAPQTSTEATALTPDKALSTAAATTSSAESVSAWRQESTSQTTTLQARSGQNSSFAQTLNAQSFNSKLGQTFGTNAWAESVSQRVSLMTAQRLGSATIELDPPELGAMTVKVSLDGDKASVNFMSANGQVREALEQSFPRLQEMLGQQGLQLADAQVSDNPSTGQNSGDSQSSGDQKSSRVSDELNGENSVHSVNVPTGLIDYYA